MLYASKVMLKIFQARLQQYVNLEFPDVRDGFKKGRGTKDQIDNIHSIIKKAGESQKTKQNKTKKNMFICFIGCTIAFDCVNDNKLWKILKEMGMPDHLTCRLRNLYAGEEATVITGHGTMELFQN